MAYSIGFPLVQETWFPNLAFGAPTELPAAPSDVVSTQVSYNLDNFGLGL